MAKGVIIQASANSKGNTYKITSYLQEATLYDVIDLNTKTINHFDYNFKNQDDDFNTLFKTIVTQYDAIVFTTPVYWYTMSGLLKVFLDRISDFLFQELDYGRKLRGKHLAIVSSNQTNETPKAIDLIFKNTTNYLGMHYLGHTHTWITQNTIANHAKNNLNLLINNLKTIH